MSGGHSETVVSKAASADVLAAEQGQADLGPVVADGSLAAE